MLNERKKSMSQFALNCMVAGAVIFLLGAVIYIGLEFRAYIERTETRIRILEETKWSN